MEKKTPKKLIVCLLKVKHGDKAHNKKPDSALEEHSSYMSDLWQRGIFWAGGTFVQMEKLL